MYKNKLNKKIISYDDDQGTIENFKYMGALAGIIIVVTCGCYFIKSRIKDDNNKSQSNRTRIEDENDSDNLSTAVVMDSGDATIYNLESYFTENNGDTCVLTTIDGEQFAFDSDSVVILTGDDSYNNAYILAENLVDENGKISTYEKDNSKVKQMVKNKNTMTR